MSTLYPECYEDYKSGQEVVDYFYLTVRLSRELPTFSRLEFCKITPSKDTTYDLKDIEDCLMGTVTRQENAVPHVGCNEDGELNEIWYYFHWRGSLRDGSNVWANSKAPSTCPKTGIKYIPHSGSKYA